MLTIGSLFSGIGGLELGLEWSGLGPVRWQVEIERTSRAVLAHHWPEADRYADIRDVGRASLTPVDLICGGFPCQDVSSAGKGAGLAGERSGLWSEFRRIVGELRPRWVVVENVTSGASRWVDAVVCGLEELGYACLPVPLSAADVGAPHARARIFIVARRLADADGLRQSQPSGSVTDERGRDRDRAVEDTSADAGSRGCREGQRDEHEGQPDAARGSATHADGRELREQPWRVGGSRGSAGPAELGDAGEAPADSSGIIGGQGQGSAGRQCAGRSVAGGEAAPDALRQGREGHRPGSHEGWPGPAEDPWRPPVGELVPLVHGVSGGMAGRIRRASIRALGLSVVPQCAEVVGWVIRELEGLTP